MKKAIVIIFAIIALGGAGYLGYNYFNNSKDVDDDVSDVDYEKSYVLNKITDYTDNGIMFYDEFRAYSGGYLFSYRTKSNEKKIVFFDKNGKDITKTIYDFGDNKNVEMRPFEKITVIQKKYLSGTVEMVESVVVNDKFEKVLEAGNLLIENIINDKYMIVSTSDENELYGLYDTSGKELIPPAYSNLSIASAYDSSSEKISEPIYLFAQKENKTGVIDINNKTIIPFEYDALSEKSIYYTAHCFDNDCKYYLINKNGVKRVIDRNNKEIINIDDIAKNYAYYDISYSTKQDIYYVTFGSSYEKRDFVKIYDSTGKYITDVELGNKYRLRVNTYTNDKTDALSYITFVDNNGVSYKLNNNYELENVGKLYCRPDNATGSDLSCFYGGDITVKVNNNGKYEVYNAAGTSKLVNQEFEFLEFKDKYAYGCLEKVDDLSGNNCGYFDYSGKVLFDFKYDGKSFDKIFELRDGSLYAASMEKILDKTGTLDKYDYFMPIKNLVTVDTMVDNKNKRTLYNLDGEVVLDNIYNVDGIMNDKLVSIEYYDKNSGYNTEIYSIDDMKTPLLNDIQLIKKFYHKDKAYYYASDGIYELTEK